MSTTEVQEELPTGVQDPKPVGIFSEIFAEARSVFIEGSLAGTLWYPDGTLNLQISYSDGFCNDAAWHLLEDLTQNDSSASMVVMHSKMYVTIRKFRRDSIEIGEQSSQDPDEKVHYGGLLAHSGRLILYGNDFPPDAVVFLNADCVPLLTLRLLSSKGN